MRFDLGSDLRTAQKRERWTDLTVRVQAREWRVHRLVLGTCSPVFAAWLDWLESKDSGVQLDLQWYMYCVKYIWNSLPKMSCMAEQTVVQRQTACKAVIRHAMSHCKQKHGSKPA